MQLLHVGVLKTAGYLCCWREAASSAMPKLRMEADMLIGNQIAYFDEDEIC